MTIKLFLLNFSWGGGGGGVKMCDKMAISAYNLKIAENMTHFKASNES